ncbi:hypothetical protein [Streptomyces sp. SPB074]|uniref:hypothetical protein n=1 Tax=Streptomyces sp. (strain SPB074) TaxID=465543 RepID=UPI00017F29B7|nr:hypothetical protein [Streptomyces sp. SPB074]EDY46389.2 conserved hypothetical protein [Streptomyces sp. SPB074]
MTAAGHDDARRDGGTRDGGTKDGKDAAVDGGMTPEPAGTSETPGEEETRVLPEVSAEPATREGSTADGSTPDGPAPEGSTPAAGSPAAGSPAAESPAAAGSPPAGSSAVNSAPADPASPDSSFGEDELRALFHGAVDGLAPGEGVLDRLQAAVPARRARKRQTLVGVAAAVILLGTAIPAAVHVAAAPGHEADPTMAGSSQDTRTAAPSSARPHEDAGREVRDDVRSASPRPSASSGHRSRASGSPSPKSPPSAGTVLADAPRCAATQLGDAAADRGTPAADGTVYGSFRVANVSGEKCAVTSAGQVRVAVLGGRTRTTVPVVEHQDGDAAADLPGTSQSALLLGPGQSYEVRFAFVPDAGCPSGDPSKPPEDPGPSSPTPSEPAQSPAESGGPGSGPGKGPDQGQGAGAGPEDPAALDRTTTQFERSVPADDAPAATVEVSHNAAPGGPVSNTTIRESCSGTLYRTGLLPAGG